MKNYIKRDTAREEDPREAILKYAKEAEEDPYYMAVYNKTQPKPIFDTSYLEEEVGEDGIIKPKSHTSAEKQRKQYQEQQQQ